MKASNVRRMMRWGLGGAHQVECLVYSGRGNILAQVPDVYESMVLGGLDELSGDFGLVS